MTQQSCEPPEIPVKYRRASRFVDVDCTFVYTVVLSAALHLTGLLHAMSIPPPPTLTYESIEGRVARLPPRVEPTPVPVPVKTEPEADQPSVASTPPPRHRDAPPPEEVNPRVSVKDRPLIVALNSRFRGPRDSKLTELLHSMDVHSIGDTIRSNDGDAAVASLGPGLKPGGRGDSNLVTGNDEVGRISSDGRMDVAGRSEKKPQFQVIPERAEVTGDIENLQSSLDKYRSGISSCYEESLKLNPTLKGKYYLEMTAAPNGRVSDCSVRSERGAPDARFVTCLCARVSRWKLSNASMLPVDISLPVVLTSTE